MLVLKLVGLGMLFAAVFILVRAAYEQITSWWLARIRTYASWLTVEFESMFETMTIERAYRLITITILGSFAFGLLLGGVFAAFVFAAAGYFVPWFVVQYLHKRRMAT